jgi:glycosyltransferase involved in cell wall biosynthesis
MTRARTRRRHAASVAATIIIPTHNRATTLPMSIESALGQSVRNIEVMIIGDGCSDACRQVALDFAARDGRVVFHDLPKAPLRGVANRDFGVRNAAGALIFYNDDDDLLLPHHVAVLSQALMSADIADTPAVSITPSGQVDLGLHDSAHSLQRELLARKALKTVFDTHLGHRKDAYLGLDAPWLRSTDWRATLHMFAAFAAKPRFRWRSVQRITALSFHGRRRAAMSDADRARELREWSRPMRQVLFEHRLRRRGSYGFHSLMLARAFAKAGWPRRDTEEFLRRLLQQASRPWQASDRQRNGLAAAVALAYAGTPDQAAGRSLFFDLLEARLGPDFHVIRETVDLFRSRFPAQVLSAWLETRKTGTPTSIYAELYLRGDAGLASIAPRAEIAYLSASSAEKFFYCAAFADLMFETGRLDAAWTWSERAAPHAPNSMHAAQFWLHRSRLALKLDRVLDANAARTKATQLQDLVD